MHQYVSNEYGVSTKRSRKHDRKLKKRVVERPLWPRQLSEEWRLDWYQEEYQIRDSKTTL
jgi:hypothetical protein